MSVEAGSAQGWWKYVGSDGGCVALDHFGASGAGAALFEEFGFTTQAVAARARDVLVRLG